MNLFQRNNRTQVVTLAVLAVLFVLAIQGMSAEDWVITTLRGLSVGAITFLVAAGFSLIFGLMDVLNLAHGTLFMVGAYIGWTVFVRPDTFVDLLTPVCLVAAGLLLKPLGERLFSRLPPGQTLSRLLPWGTLILAVGVLGISLLRYPITAWDANVYEISPITYAFQADQGPRLLPDPVTSAVPPLLLLAGLFLGGLLVSFSLAGLDLRQGRSGAANGPLPRRRLTAALILALLGAGVYFANTPLTNFLFALNTNWLFLLSVLAAVLSGALLGGVMESSLIRPLYSRPIYQLMLTFGLSFIGIEIVRAVWGRNGFTMPKPALFNGSGEGCPATSLAGWLENQCSILVVLDGRVRTYNEVFIILVGLVVLVAVWLLLQRSRLGMIIRAGVQDSAMVEALGINVRRVFTLVFALGVGLAALGGVLAAPSMGLSNGMGESLLLNVLIALAIGGLTSYPGAAAGSLIVGLLQQFIIKYGQLGIPLPFLSEPFKPTPPLVPASTVLLMVIILLVMPNGLFGKKE